MAFVDVAATDDIPAGAIRSFTVAGREILIAHHSGGYYAVARRCPHLGGDLSRGTLDGAAVTCPRHHARFDLATGRCLVGPRIGPLKLHARDVAVYQVRVDGRRILVEL